MTLFTGFLLVLVAGFFQGTFILPMTLTKKWEWEHTWATFAILGMLIFNWILALIFIPGILSVYATVPGQDIIILMLFGAGWGVGAILFGMGMDRLGMALGYPIIMGLIASLGALIPLVVFYPETLLELKGLTLLIGTGLVIVGIVYCSRGGALNEAAQADASPEHNSGSFATGLMIAIFAGVLSCLPNVGVAFGGEVIAEAKALGVSAGVAGNAVWALFFTLGFVVNFLYCLYLMLRHGNVSQYFGSEIGRNLWLAVLVGVMWIGSFYLYGMSAVHLGTWGVIIGWPLFIALSIVVGNLWGIWQGEWKEVSQKARVLLNRGMGILILAIVVVAISKAL